MTKTNNGKVMLDMWVEFVVGFELSSLREFFPGSSGFPSSIKTNILNSNGNSGKEEPPRGISTAKFPLFINVTILLLLLLLKKEVYKMPLNSPSSSS